VGYFEDAIMNCKPGDLAYVIRAEATPEMVGIVVTVLRMAIDGEKVGGRKFSVREPSWVVEANSLIPSRGYDGILRYLKQRVICDRNMRPISGVPVTDEVTEDLKEPA
jgi:hypothetical protein